MVTNTNMNDMRKVFDVCQWLHPSAEDPRITHVASHLTQVARHEVFQPFATDTISNLMANECEWWLA